MSYCNEDARNLDENNRIKADVLVKALLDRKERGGSR